MGVIIEFEAQLIDGIIHVPEAVTEQLAKGVAVRVSLEQVRQPAMSREEAWAGILDFIHEHSARTAKDHTTAYQWRRSDAYEHLEKYDVIK